MKIPPKEFTKQLMHNGVLRVENVSTANYSKEIRVTVQWIKETKIVCIRSPLADDYMNHNYVIT